MPRQFRVVESQLNIFQKSMLQWNELHPYSAVHVAQIPGVLQPARLQSCITATLEQRGLTGLSLNRKRSTFEYQGGGADCEIQTLNGGEAPVEAVIAEMGRQLNLPFPERERFCPFRFLIAPAGGSFFVGLTYFHPVADAEAVFFLLMDIVNRYREASPANSPGPLERYPDSRAHLLRRHPLVVACKLLGLPAQSRNLRHSHRVRYRAGTDMTNGFTSLPVSSADLRLLIAAAKAWSVTVNDVLLALLLTALAPFTRARMTSRKRRKLSVGCIVSLRKDLGMDGRQTFGLFLGSFTVTHAVPEGISLRELVKDVRQQTAAIKRRKLYLGTPLELGLARLTLKLFPSREPGKFYAKNYPLWGGITNMNLNSLWTHQDGEPPLDYFRGVATGPITPLVLSMTTLGDRANIGMSYRSAVFSAADIESLAVRFLEPLQMANCNL